MLTECYYDATTSGKSDTGKGTPKTTAELKSDATITNWDKDIWAIEEFANDGYPYIMKNFQMTERVLLDYSDRTVSVSAYADVATATLIVASYSEGALVDIEFDENFSIDKGETKTHTLSNDFKEIVGGSVKVMLWKSFETASPLCTFKEVQIR